jgi:hypothetical protein
MKSGRIPAGAAVCAIAIACAVATPSRATDFHVHGLLDVVAAQPGDAYDQNVLTRGDASFDAYGVRMFCDAQINPRLQFFTQAVLRDAVPPYLESAYLTFTPSPSHDLQILAGKIPWAIGTYAPRSYSDKNPLIGTPLMYQYHTTLVWYDVPQNADALLNTRGTGQTSVNYGYYNAGRGMPIVDDSYWDVGVTFSGSMRPLEFAIGGVNGTPGWASTSEDDNSGKTVLGRIGLAPLPGVRFGVSGSYGPYLESSVAPKLPPGKLVTDYHQTIGMADAEFFFGHIEARAEAAHNVWQSVTVGDLSVDAGYAEIKYLLSFGAYLAGRYDIMRFGKIADSAGQLHPWDYNVNRLEAGVGYRFNRAVLAKVIYQQNIIDQDANPDLKLDMFAAQLSTSF